MIDTLSIASDLVAAGVAKPQAEAHARAIASAVGQQYGDLATKDFVRSEIGTLRSDMNAEIGSVRGEISALRAEMNAEIGSLRAEMIGEIGSLRSDMNGKIGALRADMNAETSSIRADMSAMEVRLVRWIVGSILTVGGLVFVALNFVSS